MVLAFPRVSQLDKSSEMDNPVVKITPLIGFFQLRPLFMAEKGAFLSI